MAATEPIRNKGQLKALANYFLKRGQFRNYALIIVGTSTALRISDLLKLKWTDVYDEKRRVFHTHVTIVEMKTGKAKTIALNKQVLQALRLYLPHRRGDFIFASSRGNANAISRVQAWRIIRTAAMAVGLHGMHIYNHSDYAVTRRYLGVDQDALDRAYLGMELFS